ncbi:hypothetical protein [Lysobacter sp. Root690]|uniref:hypothetical protein n=1 Tax=Lysobacter sp. Root690 TaxID=1736588 RepID=UPI000B2941A9|nr:hypothetical protein [Lysobacter sp. Root690]
MLQDLPLAFAPETKTAAPRSASLSWISQVAAVLIFFLSTIASSPVHAQNPMDDSGAASVAYLACVLEARPATVDAATRSLVERCGYDPGMPIDQFVSQTLAALPSDPLAPVAQQLAPIREQFTDKQFSYVVSLDNVLQTSKSFEEMFSQLSRLETQAINELGRSEQDMKILGALSAARHGLAFLSNFEDGRVSPMGFWRDLLQVGKVVGAFAAGFIGGGPILACICAWGVMALMN